VISYAINEETVIKLQAKKRTGRGSAKKRKPAKSKSRKLSGTPSRTSTRIQKPIEFDDEDSYDSNMDEEHSDDAVSIDGDSDEEADIFPSIASCDECIALECAKIEEGKLKFIGRSLELVVEDTRGKRAKDVVPTTNRRCTTTNPITDMRCA